MRRSALPHARWAALRVALLRLALLAAAVSPLAATALRAAEPPDLLANLAAPADGVAHGRRLAEAERLMEQQRWAEAEAILAGLARDYPLHGPTWGQLATARRRQEKWAEALPAYERVMAIQGPGLVYNARYWTAVAQAKLGRRDAALDTMHELVFTDAYLQRPELVNDPNFASLEDHPRLRTIAGRVDVSGLDRVAGWRHDVDHLVAEVKRNDPGAGELPPELFRLAEELKARVPELTDHQVIAGLGRILHTLGRGHTALWLGYPGSRFAFRPLPLRLWWFPEGLFVTSGREGQEDLWTGQIVAFDGVPTDEVLRRLAAAQSSESPLEVLWISPYLLTLPELLHGLGVARQPDRVELTVRMLDGRTVTRTVPVIAGDAPQPVHRLEPPLRGPAPRFLSHNGEMHWLDTLPERDAVYVQVNNVMNDEDETLGQLGLRLRGVLADPRWRYVVLDLRHNNGGNTFTYVELLRTLVAFSTGEGHRVFALVGRDVYSAAANLTTDLERLVRPTFVGEPTAATGNQWGDESQFVLPWSGIAGAVAGVRWQLSHPWDRRRSVVPQVPVPLPARQYFAGWDPPLDAVFRIIDEERAAAAGQPAAP